MRNLLYSAIDIAAVISSQKLSCQGQGEFLDQTWENEKPFFQEKYRNNKRQLLLDVYYWLSYFSDKKVIDAEIPILQKDAELMGREFEGEAYTADKSDLDLFFKNIRLRIYGGVRHNYIRITRRRLLGEYGYERLTSGLKEYFHQCQYFYHIQSYVRDYEECSIENAGMDTMLIFRVI